MNRRRAPAAPFRGRLAVPLLSAALVLSSCTAAQDPGPDDEPTTPATGPASPTPGGTGGPPSGTGAEKDAGAGAEPGSDDSGTGDPPTTDGPDDGAGGAEGSGGQSGGEGSEVVPPAPESRGDRLGDSPPPAAGRLTRKQQTGTAAGLVAGFPDDVVLIPAGATVTSSSVTGGDGRYQVTLAATVGGACDPVVLDYRVWFTTGGFTETGAAPRPDGTTVDLAREDGTVQLGTTGADAGCEVTVFAVLSVR